MVQHNRRSTDNPAFMLPTTAEAPANHLPAERSSPKAAFLSQLIAERQNLAPQRVRRRATADAAVDAYETGAKAATVRMPVGYRKTVIV
jgi:hypothetical protein